MHTIFLALGTNLGDRLANIENAIKSLKEKGVVIEIVSSIIESAPDGGPHQDDYLNAVLKGNVSISPKQLLDTVKQIEKEMGRKKTVINGPRIIDIDILLYDKISLNTKDLIIPHPRMRQRNFVISPLIEIEPALKEIKPL
ncbi:MAG: 2-amino-4-hydroxy-6-hydroxymethyldihydropteridine diphosphokinase [Candidatus Omnitrophica bacterium]|nr:2-amino-4-hydroxy-6-hydroxymethyldihydropteridine diphosphokinase [Candidatus Omnitrophota bacterium]